MKKFEDLTLEDAMAEVYNEIKKMRVWQILLAFLLIMSLIIDFYENTGYRSTLPIILISVVLFNSNSNARAIAKLYEKIKSTEKDTQ